MSFSEYFIRSALWPSMLYTIIVMIIGVLGNSLIIYIYRRHFYKSVPWLFIYVLSILDLLACVVNMPSELAIIATFTAFPSAILCKFSRYLSFTFHGSSCVILMAIAFNRYEKVCRPNKQVLSLKRAKIFCSGTVVYACVSYVPCFFIYGELVYPIVEIGDDVKILPLDFNMTQVVTMNLTLNDVTNGKFCLIAKDASKAVVIGFYIFQFLQYVILVVLITFFYSKVIRKMISYGRKQKQLLNQMCFQASRTDHVRGAPNNKGVAATKDGPTADFSQDFCRNEITAEFDQVECGENQKHVAPHNAEKAISLLDANNGDEIRRVSSTREDNSKESLRIQISPPIINEMDETEKPLLKQGVSENNINRVSTTHSSGDPMETNKLLIRRYKSSDDFKFQISQLQILPPVDPYDAMFEPIFLHAPKTQKKKEKGSSSFRKSKKSRSKSVSRSKSSADVSLRSVKPKKRDENARSLEGLATLRCDNTDSNVNNNNCIDINTIQDGTLTLTRRTTPKGSKNCIIPISTTLSMKSAVSYNAFDPKGNNHSQEKMPNCKDKSIETMDGGKLSWSNNQQGEDTRESIDLDNCNLGVDTTDVGDDDEGDPRTRRDTGVSFKKAVTVIHGPNNAAGVQLRRRSESTSNPPSRGSENILTPSPKSQAVDYRRRQSVRPIRANRTSRILFWISLAFVLSFLPFWIIIIIRTISGPNQLAEISHAELGVMSLFIRFTLISNAINPLIYGLMNSQFRQRCSAVFQWSQKRPNY